MIVPSLAMPPPWALSSVRWPPVIVTPVIDTVACSATSKILKSVVVGAVLRAIVVPRSPTIVICPVSTGSPLPPSVSLLAWVSV